MKEYEREGWLVVIFALLAAAVLAAGIAVQRWYSVEEEHEQTVKETRVGLRCWSDEWEETREVQAAYLAERRGR